MSLANYKQKRDFTSTPEPKPEAYEKPAGSLCFVMHKHRASHLHYDLRLELDGVLKSWAVPKGPSLNPSDKRLAMMVEDHPYDYQYFEGVIPKGNYGAGEVIIWDKGTYHSLNSTDKNISEGKIKEGLKRGHVDFYVNGQKLKGAFSLIKINDGKDNAWLLIKKSDSFAGSNDIIEDDKSVVSGKTIDDLHYKKEDPTSYPINLNSYPRADKPHLAIPMFAETGNKPFDEEAWLFEIKWDGYRAIADVELGSARLYSRRGNSFNQFNGLVLELSKLPFSAILDGEVVVLDTEGQAHFQLLQEYQLNKKGTLVYYVFDIIYLNGHLLTNAPLYERKEILKKLLAQHPSLTIRYSDHVLGKGTKFYAAAKEQGLEGVMAKHKNSVYLPGKRSFQWLKIRISKRQEAIIAGFTAPRGERKGIGALILGVYDGDDLIYIGHTGTGFTEDSLKEIHGKLIPLIQPTSPLKETPHTNAPATWVQPQLVCEIQYTEWTREGHLRHPVFLGLREDKDPHEIQKENNAEYKPAILYPLPSSDLSLKVDETTVTISNYKKVWWPEAKYTKEDLAHYYQTMATTMLPYLSNRPESLHRQPNGSHDSGFWQKNYLDPVPPWVDTITIRSESEERDNRYIMCNSPASIVFLANLGCIELHPWLSQKDRLDYPDFCVIDLDPENIPFRYVVKTALAAHTLCTVADIPLYAKTSGSRGLHLCVPLGAQYKYDDIQLFAKILAQLIHKQVPLFTSLERSPASRQRRVYIDYLQNGRGKTIAAPYSVRPTQYASVSTPLRWSEVNDLLDPKNFTIENIPARIKKIGDIWAPVLEQDFDLIDALMILRDF